MNAANSISTAPYPGLRPFKQEEAELFFGRETQTNEMLTRLEAQSDFRFLAVIGASGSGKSSLVRAGLLPALSQGFLLGAPADWKFVTARPGDAPLRNLANAWVDTFHPQTDQPDAAESERYSFALAQLRAGPLGLVRACRGEKATQGHAVLILIDQFEELFRFRRERDSDRRAQPVPSTIQSGQDEPLDETSRTKISPTTDNAPTPEQQRNEAAAFVELLLATARQTEVPMYVVITMRSDFLGNCDAFLGLPEAISRSQYLTPRMTRSQLEDAITRPLELPQFNARIEPTLVTRILNDVGTDPDQLPLMQHALMRTWFEAQGRSSGENEDIVLTPVDYSNAGRFSDALSQHLDEAWKPLPEGQQRIAQQLFLCLSERTREGALIRRVVKLGDVAAVANAEPGEVSKVVRVFQENERNFIIASPSGELGVESVLDISHEALLRQWGRLRSWLEAEATSVEEYIRLADSARRWKAGDAELLQGRALQRAQEWKQNRKPTAAWAERYHPEFASALRFLNDSVAERERLEKQEAEQRQRELMRARKITLVKIVMVLLLSVLTVIAFVFGIKANNATETANTEKEKALLGEKAALAKELHSKEPLKALVLAIQATGESQSKLRKRLPRVESSLLAAIQVSEWSSLFKAHDAGMTSVAMTPDGNTIVSGSGDKTVRLWDRQGTPIGEPRWHEGAVRSVAMTPDGNMIVSGSDDKTVRLWDRQGTPIGEPRWHEGAVRSVAMTPDGNTIVSGSGDKTVRLWDRQGTPIGDPLRGHGAGVTSVAMTPDGNTIVSGSSDKTVRLWNRQGTPIGDPLRGHDAGVRSVAMTPDGNTIVSGSDDKTVRLWNRQGTPIGEPRWHEGAVRSVAMTPDGNTIVSSSDDKTVRLWNRQGTPIGEPRWHEGAVVSLAISPDGKTIVSGSGDGTVRLWALESDTMGKPLTSYEKGEVEKMALTSIAISPDGKTIVSGSGNGTVRLWDREGRPIGDPLRGHDAGVRSVAMTPDGNTIVSGSDNGIVRLWNRQGTPIGDPLRGHNAEVTSVAITPDGKTIVSGSDDKTVRLWNRQGTPIGDPLRGHNAKVTSVAITPDGKTIVSGSDNGIVRLWNPQGSDKNSPKFLRGHDKRVTSVAFSPDGEYIVSRSTDMTLQLWNSEGTPMGDPFTSLKGKTGGKEEADSTGVTFTADAHDVHIVTVSRDNMTVWRWPVGNSKTWLPLACERVRNHDVLVDPDNKIAKEIVEEVGTDTVRNAAEICLKFGGWTADKQAKFQDRRRLASARAKVWEGRQLAQQGKLAEAIAAFQAAQQLVPDIDLDPETEKSSEKDPQAVAQHLAAPAKVRQGRQLAQQGKLAEAIAAFRAARQLVPGIDLDPETEKSSEKDPQAVAQLLVARAKVRQGRQLAWQGDVGGAIAAFQAARQLVPGIDLDPETEKSSEKDPQAVAQLLVARAKVRQGRQLAQQGKLAEAIAAFQAAQQLVPDIDLDPETEKSSEKDPQAVAQHLAAPAKVRQGRQLAQQGKLAEAIAAFQAAQQLVPDIDLDPETEKTSEKDPQAVVQRLAARAKAEEQLDLGQKLTQKGAVEKALQAYAEAEKLDPSLTTEARFWNIVGWAAGLGGHATKALEASEKAVRLTAKDDPSLADRLAGRRDTRGLARALTGDTPGAIEDFEAFIGSDARPELKAQRQEWVDALRKGQQPFTPQLLEKLWSQ